ncbi:hypothetical protein [uncultured Mediterranean phage uvMED]|jgi:hypothetical protein|nr:hypothetical protein [uncultured Mediterranean phage uvMED]
MAILKIPQSQSRVRERQVTQTAALTLPMSLATQRGKGFAAIGKVVEDMHKEQVAVEDNARLLEVIREASTTINQVSAAVSKNTDMQTAIDLFENSTKAESFDGLVANDRSRVKKEFNQWLQKTKISEYSSIAKKVTKNHIDKTKTVHNNYLDDLTIKMSSSDLTKASNARTDFNSFFNKAVNGSVYSSSEFAKLKEDKLLQAEKNIVVFGARNHPNYTINNYDEIEKRIGTKLAQKALETAKQKIAADQDFNIKQEEFVEQADIRNKVGTYTELLLRIKNDKDPEYLGKIPTLDLLNDLVNADKINSAQYDALLRFYKDPESFDDEVLDLVNGQIFVADSIEALDKIQNNMNFSPEYLMSIGIKDATTMTSLIDRYKNDREVFQDSKEYLKVINNVLGAVENTIIRDFGAAEKGDQDSRVQATRLYNEFISEGMAPRDAFIKMTRGYLFQKGKLPTLAQAAPFTSFNIDNVSKIQEDQDPSKTFNGWRDQLMSMYKKNTISMNDLKRDLDALDIREDLFKIRSKFGTALGNEKFAWSDENTTASDSDAIVRN